ncbi:MAG: 7-cyano-7-deazaguanine synthase, partial [Alphaproteobacteria bacterium]|nr:7-cyano-7-deazaguanine synthase [Alphaproteobacteria bacterium]
MSKTAAVAMSGGLDSSVTAMLLKQQGFEVVGVTGKMVESPCADIICENAKKVADKLGIGFSVIDLTQEFNTSV